MSTWIDPNLLSLVGLGTAGDPDLADGRHLRWFFGAPLGFPRSGFRLRRRTSMALADWNAAAPPIQSAWTSQTELGIAPSKRFDSGLTVSKEGWLNFASAGGSAPSLRIDSNPIGLDFGPSGTGPTFPSGPNLSNPAVFVRLTVVRRKRTGHVLAAASYDARGSYRQQDRGAVGSQMHGWLPGDWGNAVNSAAGLWLRSAAETMLDPTQHTKSENEAARVLAVAGRVPSQDGHASPPHDLNPWVTQTILLRGSFLDHVEITGSDAVLVRVQWVPVRAYSGDPLWVDVDRFYLPLTDAPDLYPQWIPQVAEQVVDQRLAMAPPRRLLPWDEPGLSVADNLSRRYRGDSFSALDRAMRIFLKGQIAQVVPQSEVTETHALASNDGDPAAAMSVDVRPFEHLYASAIDPQVARILGLMTSDLSDAAATYDYAIDMAVPPLWIDWALFPEVAEAQARDLRAQGIDGGNGLREHMRPETCLAMVAALARKPSTPPGAPADLRAEVEPDVVASPVQAHVELSWPIETQSVFENQGRSKVFFSGERDQGGVSISLLHKDDVTGLRLPLAPTQRTPADGRFRLMDRAIPAWDTYTWSLRGMDLWGRWSAAATITTEVRDTLPPPTPTSQQAALEGPGSAAPIWEAVTIAFDWTAAQDLLAPDLDRFELHLRQGWIDRTAAGFPGTWGRFEHIAGASDPAVVLQWPSRALSGLPAGLSGSVATTPISDEEGGGVQITVRIGPIRADFDPAEQAQTSATVRAIDRFGNASGWGAHATATRMRETPPVVPAIVDDLAFASMADAEGKSSYAIRWPDCGSGRIRVMRASARSLLSAANADVTAYETLTANQQAALLRDLAIGHPEVFAADHEYPYSARAGEHKALFGARAVGLSVFTIEVVSLAEVRSPWPSQPAQFVVVAARPRHVPAPPLASEVRGGDRSASLRVKPDPRGEVTALRLYRARDFADAEDIRRMRLVRELAVSDPAAPTLLTDDGLYPDIDYLYRIVALTADGTRSMPSAVLRVRPITSVPPDPPRITTVTRVGTTNVRRIVCEIARRDQRLTLQRLEIGSFDWVLAGGPHVHAGVVDVMALAPTPMASGYRVEVEDDSPPAGNARYAYRLRVDDARGRSTDSLPHEEAP